MDEIVKQAMAKWPNVPHCYGWLALDSRGDWRMRDERAQALGLLGDKLQHTALIAFINRNYEADANGNWYFQNGPQRVYVNLQATPFILHLDSQQELRDHTGASWQKLDALWLDSEGKLIAQAGKKIGQLDDRDLASCLKWFTLAGKNLSDDDWQAWLEGQAMDLYCHYAGSQIKVQRLANPDLAQQFSFCARPSAKN